MKNKNNLFTSRYKKKHTHTKILAKQNKIYCESQTTIRFKTENKTKQSLLLLLSLLYTILNHCEYFIFFLVLFFIQCIFLSLFFA